MNRTLAKELRLIFDRQNPIFTAWKASKSNDKKFHTPDLLFLSLSA